MHRGEASATVTVSAVVLKCRKHRINNNVTALCVSHKYRDILSSEECRCYIPPG